MNEYNWIPITERLPEAVHGEESKPPIISDDVVVLFESGDTDIANYDHEDSVWSLVNHGFKEPDCDPTHWLPLPPLIDVQPASAGRGDTNDTPIAS